MKSIDLNADLGEGMDFDDQLLQIVSSASVACGGHAGNADIMERTLRAAKNAGVTTGAHPGFVDPENFGRVRLDLPVAKVAEQVIEQLQAISEIAAKVGKPISYVKLHGALYNQASEQYEFARIIFAKIEQFNPELAILALDNSAQLKAARDLGLNTIPEAFADRAYDIQGLLVSRTEPGSVFADPADAVAQAIGIAGEGTIVAHDGTRLRSHAKSICLHGDNDAALEIARAIKQGLSEQGIAISSAV